MSSSKSVLGSLSVYQHNLKRTKVINKLLYYTDKSNEMRMRLFGTTQQIERPLEYLVYEVNELRSENLTQIFNEWRDCELKKEKLHKQLERMDIHMTKYIKN